MFLVLLNYATSWLVLKLHLWLWEVWVLLGSESVAHGVGDMQSPGEAE